MNTRIICALFKKDLKGCLSNKNILVSFLIPIVFCFIYQYMFSGLGDDVNTYVLSISELNETVAKLAVIVPTTSFQTLYRAAVAGRGIFTGKCFTALCVCVVWIIGGYILFNIFYRRKGIDC